MINNLCDFLSSFNHTYRLCMRITLTIPRRFGYPPPISCLTTTPPLIDLEILDTLTFVDNIRPSWSQRAENFGRRRKREGHKPAPSVFNKHSAKAAVSLERRRGRGREENLSSAPQPAAFLHRIFPAKRKGLKFSFDFRGKSDPSLATAGIRSLGAAKLIKSLTADEFAVVWTDISVLLVLSTRLFPAARINLRVNSLDPQISVYFFAIFFFQTFRLNPLNTTR